MPLRYVTGLYFKIKAVFISIFFEILFVDLKCVPPLDNSIFLEENRYV